MRRVGAYLIILVNSMVVMFVDPEAYEKGRSVPYNPCEWWSCSLTLKRMRRVGAYLIILVNAMVVMLVDSERYDKVGAYVTLLLNATEVRRRLCS